MPYMLTLICFSVIPTLVSPKVYTFPLETRSTIVNRRLQGDTDRVSTLYQGSGTHYIDLWVGSPEPQRQTVIVDTGSTVTAFPCNGCEDCGEGQHIDQYFDFESSKTFSKLSCGEGCELGHCGTGACEISMSYEEGSSWNAFAAKDVVYPGGKHDAPVNASLSFEMNFGCQTSLKGLFKDQLESGIMGMGHSRNDESLWQQMYNSGKLDKKMFSLCYIQQKDFDKKGTLAGAMTLGGYDDKLWKTPVVYADMSSSGSFYSVNLKGVYLWNGDPRIRSLRNLTAIEGWQQNVKTVATDESTRFSNTIVDSGTTSTYLNPAVRAPFEKAWNEMVGAEVSNELFEMTNDQLNKLPTVLLRIGGKDHNKHLDAETTPGLAGLLGKGDEHDVLIAITPLRYIIYLADEKKFRSKIFFQIEGKNIIGANAMVGHDVVFDIDNQRVGFAESDCSYGNTAMEHPVESPADE